MGKPKLSLQVPANHTITLNSAEGAQDSFLHGQISFNNVSQQCDIQIIFARVGRLERGRETKNDTASKKLMSELGLKGSQKEQKREEFDYETAEKLYGCSIRLPQGAAGSKPAKCDFDLQMPSYLPATAALPSVNISYAIFATCVLPNGKILQASQDLRIIRKHAERICLEPSRTVSFPETSFAVKASFDPPEHGSKHVTIPTTLQLNGLKLPITSSMRITETRWLVPREVKWELEETAVIITGIPDATGHLPMSSTQRICKKRKLAIGKQKLKLKYPFTRRGNTPIRILSSGTGMSIPLPVTAPSDVSLGDTTALSVAGAHILHTIQAAEAPLDPHLPRSRFAVHIEYKLHIWLRIGEDVFDAASGDLVNRKMDEMAYTIVCPLTTAQSAHAPQTGCGEETPPMVPPSYDGVWERPPPEYTMSGV